MQVYEAVDLACRGVGEVVKREYAGVVDQNVYPQAVAVDEFLDAFRSVRAGKVEEEGECTDAVGAGDFAARLEQFLFLDAHHDYVGPARGESAAEFESDARRAAGDESRISFKVSL